ncbi:hypothetical protein HD806DRAFT_413050 [Xylariaceae sp. AK1471]|nr:hypothetical protein HD806DRAFT_413050 [Xylariaceae sp. AK1471]
MTAGQINLPDTPAPAANTAGDGPPIARAPRKDPGPATPSRLCLALLDNIASSPSLVTATDYLPHSPLIGKDGKGNSNSSNGMKRMRVDDHANLEKGSRDVNIRSAPTDCRDQVTLALDRDRSLYEAKMKMFQDCADAIDKTLQKAGTDLYRQGRIGMAPKVYQFRLQQEAQCSYAQPAQKLATHQTKKGISGARGSIKFP